MLVPKKLILQSKSLSTSFIFGSTAGSILPSDSEGSTPTETQTTPFGTQFKRFFLFFLYMATPLVV